MNLDKILKKRGVSQRTLARWLNVSHTAVHLWATGETKPHYDTLIKMCELLECSYTEMMGEHNDTRLQIDKALDKMTERELRELLRHIRKNEKEV